MTPGFWRGKKVLITGHTGFKGSWLSLWLQQLEATVIGYALAPPTQPSLFELAHVAQGTTSITGDVRDYVALKSAMAQHEPDIVIHMAAQPLVRHSYDHPVETYATNIMGSVHVLEAARQTPSVKVIINVTSDKCYQNSEWDWGYRESDTLGGHDPYSSSKAHAKRYSEDMAARFGLHGKSRVIEIASNDGYLLQYFKQRDIPVLGVEPAANVAKVAQAAGIETLIKFFGTDTAVELASKGMQADLLLGNNVLTHVPDINDFVAGLKILLKPEGVITMEFPHLASMMEKNQFDTIYHEHFSYFSLSTAEKIFARHGLRVFDVEELPTHGDSLRVYARHCENSAIRVSNRTGKIRKYESDSGLGRMETYARFSERVREVKSALLQFLIKARRQGKSVVGYGAPAKGNTLLNYCGIRTDYLDYTVDASPHKQGCLLPGTRIPVYHPDKIRQTKPDYLLILPWNIRNEIISQMAYIREWGGQFVIPIPRVEVLSPSRESATDSLVGRVSVQSAIGIRKPRAMTRHAAARK